MSPACLHDGCICQPLPAMKRGDRVVVRHLHGEAGDCQRLREMGFHEMAEVQLVCGGGTVIAQVQGARICLSHRMAESILVASA